MSSFASLFGGSVDKTVDDLFSNTADGPVSRGQSVKRTVVVVPKREVQEEQEEDDDEQEEEDDEQEEEEEEDDQEQQEESEEEEQPKKKSKKSDANDDLEARYFDKLLQPEANQEEKPEEVKSSRPAKTIDLKETELEKAERTVFVGNVPASVVTSKPLAKQFKNLFKTFGKIDSVRFRSISFEENLPRKISFAKKNLHKSRDSVNAYVVFNDKSASKDACKLNGTIFETHHLRVDHVAHPAAKDTKRSIFVGNLDFEEKEDNLWKYFNKKLNNDVESVRIIRDSKTNLGKGFALVQFKDSLSVNKALLLNEKPISVDGKNGRKLRISRAKSHSKPSLMSPNHMDNLKKTHAANKSRLNDTQKTKLGRAKTILGKADRSTVGKRVVMEGERATKGSRIAGIKGLKGKGGKVKKPRIRDRSTKFKQERETISNSTK
ncbi:Nucleolar protein 12 [Spathaspora sp. JA1]|nr:Nucleolar protein 12 [Spathaspora sp. JA1]